MKTKDQQSAQRIFTSERKFHLSQLKIFISSVKITHDTLISNLWIVFYIKLMISIDIIDFKSIVASNKVDS
jgi:hypothetical protein